MAPGPVPRRRPLRAARVRSPTSPLPESPPADKEARLNRTPWHRTDPPRPRLRAWLATTWILSLALLPRSGFAREPHAFGKPATCYVKMADGTALATDVYLPLLGGPRWPTRLIRTPYNRRHLDDFARRVTLAGYALVVQDMRGRFDSGGQDRPFFDSGGQGHGDGVTTLRWIRRQDWSDGRICTEGGSALGITQHFLAVADPLGLVAQHIQVAVPSLYPYAAYPGGAKRLSLIDGWFTHARFDPSNAWLVDLRPFDDAHWHRLDTLHRVDNAAAAAVHVGGWFDVFSQGTIDGFLARRHRGGASGRDRQYLIMGPWAHKGPAQDVLGVYRLPSNAVQPPTPLPPGRFFKWMLAGDTKALSRVPAVQYYTMGTFDDPTAPGHRWQTADDWPPPSEPRTLYLHADGRLDALAPEGDTASLHYEYDPADPSPTIGGALLYGSAGPMDQQPLTERDDVLTFQSDVCKTPLEVTGRIRVHLHVVSDGIDTDFSARLTDVYPDGRCPLIADGLTRCRARQGTDRTAWLTPEKPAEVTIDLGSTSFVFAPGHRIGLLISSSNYPKYDINPNTGWPYWPGGPMRIARNEIRCRRSAPSRLILPTIPQQ